MKGVPMRVETTMRRWRMALVAVAGLCGLGAAVVAAGPSSPAVAAQQDVVVDLINGNDPLTKFAKLMPVITHARCINCHGVTDPFTGKDHEGGALTPDEASRVPLTALSNKDIKDMDKDAPDFNAVCVTCHDDGTTKDSRGVLIPFRDPAKSWRLAPRGISFVGKSARDICRMWKVTKGTATELKRHFAIDPLANNSFLGTKGMLKARVERPPLTKQQFDDLAADWLRGSDDILCGGWEGTITQTESVSEETTANGLPGLSAATIHEKQTATRTVTVTINGGVKVAITLSATDSIENNMNVPGCTAVGRSVATIRPKSGSTAIDDAKSARIRFSPDGKYTISIQLPDEVNERTEASEFQQCVLGLMKETPTVVELPHIGWSIDMDGTLSNPSDRTELIGKPDPVIRTGDDAWLTGSGGVIQPFQVEGSQNRPVSVTVTTTWNLRRVP